MLSAGWFLLLAAACIALMFIFKRAEKPTRSSDARPEGAQGHRTISVSLGQRTLKDIAAGNYTPPAAMDLIHAKPGSHDETAFISPKTGRFQFPKYKRDPRYRVQIKDVSDHAENRAYLRDMYDAEEVRTYGISDFEQDIGCFDIDMEVTPFDEFFSKLKKEELSPCSLFLKSMEEFLSFEELALGDDWHECVETETDASGNLINLASDDQTTKQLLDLHMLKIAMVTPPPPSSLERHLKSLLKAELIPFCRQYGVDPKAKKADMIEALCATNMPIPEPEPYPEYAITDKGREYLSKIYGVYLDELLANLKRVHPLLIAGIMDSASEAADEWRGLQDLIDAKTKEAFWLKDLCRASTS